MPRSSSVTGGSARRWQDRQREGTGFLRPCRPRHEAHPGSAHALMDGRRRARWGPGHAVGDVWARRFGRPPLASPGVGAGAWCHSRDACPSLIAARFARRLKPTDPDSAERQDDAVGVALRNHRAAAIRSALSARRGRRGGRDGWTACRPAGVTRRASPVSKWRIHGPYSSFRAASRPVRPHRETRLVGHQHDAIDAAFAARPHHFSRSMTPRPRSLDLGLGVEPRCRSWP